MIRATGLVWALRVGGLLIIAFGVFIVTDPRVKYRTEMSKDKNILAFLETGQVLEGKVTKAYYRRGAPEGWAVYYKFTVRDVETTHAKEFSGNSEGPKKYYSGLVAGDLVQVIYLPENPEINCEVKRLLNYPVSQATFEKAGKLGLLDKFRDEYEIENYSLEKWYREQQEK